MESPGRRPDVAESSVWATTFLSRVLPCLVTFPGPPEGVGVKGGGSKNIKVSVKRYVITFKGIKKKLTDVQS